MKSILSFNLLLALVVAVSAQESTSITQETKTKPAPAVIQSEPIKDLQLLPDRKIPDKPTASQRSSFQERLNRIIERGEPLQRQAPAKPLNGNYQIKIDHTLNGKSASFSIVTADAKFSYQGFGTSVNIDGNSIPSTLEFEGELSRETEGSIFFQFFYGQTVPFVTGSSRDANGKRSASQIQQIKVGMKNGAVFPFGKSVRVVESDGETLIITIHKVEP